MREHFIFLNLIISFLKKTNLYAKWKVIKQEGGKWTIFNVCKWGSFFYIILGESKERKNTFGNVRNFISTTDKMDIIGIGRKCFYFKRETLCSFSLVLYDYGIILSISCCYKALRAFIKSNRILVIFGYIFQPIIRIKQVDLKS